MPLLSLHTICLHRICDLLKKGTWKLCEANPFSELPTQDVNKLMELSLLYTKDYPKIGDVIQLLTSGKLLRLDLIPFYMEIEQDLIVKVAQTRSSRISSRNFASHSKEVFVYHLVRDITSANSYLEEFYSYFHPGFDVIRNCQNIRILKIFPYNRGLHFDNLQVDFSVLSSLRNLEVLSLPNMDTETIANILVICPKLISIGKTDSLDSMEEVNRRLNNSTKTHLQLRRCVWSKDYSSLNPMESSVHDFEFCAKVRFAVTLCPLVQEVIFYVHFKEAIKELKVLKHLTLLKMNFDVCKSNYVQEFVALLQEIGPQLKHLSIFWSELLGGDNGIPIDVIADCCPHLESLEIKYFSFGFRFSSGASRNFPFKRLSLLGLSSDPEGLLFLLSNSKHLEELFIVIAKCFDDALLSKIFERNPLSELKVVSIDSCNITRVGFQKLVERASSIETVYNCSRYVKYFYDVHRAVTDPNLRVLEDPHFYVQSKDFFYRLMNEKIF